MASSIDKTGPDVTDPAAYIANVLAALNDRDPLDAYAQTVGELRKCVASHPVERLRSRPYKDRWTWTPLEVIGHLVDAEWSIGGRTRAVFCEDQPILIGVGQDHWVAAQKHNDRDPSELVEDFAVLREINLRFWCGIPADKLERVGQHNERGAESLGDMLKLYAAHDCYHLAQIDRYLAALA